jgi:Putative peptidoglycan binding domain
MVGKRTGVLFAVIGFAALIAAVAWLTAGRIESPGDAAARTAPPTPSPILVPIESRVLASTLVTRGTARFGLPQKLSLVPSPLKGAASLLATLPTRNAALQEGSVLLTASGRPVFVLQGKLPMFRDLAPGSVGDDVRQLEQALARLGFEPGAQDGVYDAQTSAAVARWYRAKKWDPFGPTREQLLALHTLERDWADAEKQRLAASAALAAAALVVESARAGADLGWRTAQADLLAKQGETKRASSDTGTPLWVESERAKTAHANSAAEADLAAQTAERALVVLDPRQPVTARQAAEARLELARANVRKTRIEGELSVLAAERETRQASGAVALSEAALRAAKLEGQKAVQAAIDAQKAAELEARTSDQRANRLTNEVTLTRQRTGVQVPADEVVFIQSLPVRVEEVSALVGSAAVGAVLSVTDNQLAIDSSLPLDAAALVKPGMAVAIDELDLGLKGKGVVQQVAATSGTRGVDNYHFYFEVKVLETQNRLEGASLRLTIPTESTKGPVLAVPTSALSLAADGTSRVQVQATAPDAAALKYVVVTPGLSTGGYVEITPVGAVLKPGQMVVVGYKTEARAEPNVEPKPELKPEPKPEPKSEPKADRGPAAKVAPP